MLFFRCVSVTPFTSESYGGLTYSLSTEDSCVIPLHRSILHITSTGGDINELHVGYSMPFDMVPGDFIGIDEEGIVHTERLMQLTDLNSVH